MVAGAHDECLTTWERVYHRFMARDEVSRAAQLAIQVGFLWMLRGERSVGSGWLHRASQLLEDLPEGVPHGYMRYLEAARALGEGRSADAARTARRIVQLAASHHDATLQAIGLVTEGVAVVKQGRVEAGLSMLDEAMLPVRAGEVEPNWAGNLYCQLIGLFLEIGDIPRARDWTDAIERWCDQHHDPVMYRGICRVHRAQLLLLDGAWQAAEDHASRACRDLAAMDVEVVAEGHYVIGELHRLRGDVGGAEAAYARAHELGRDPQPGRALLGLAAGRVREVGRALQTALVGVDHALDRVPILMAQIDLAVAAGDAALAESAAEELDDVAEAYATAGLRAAARQASGVRRLLAGEPERALPLLRDAVRRWCELDAGHSAATARCLLARALEAIGDASAAQREREAATAVFETLGAAPPVVAVEPRGPASGTRPLSPREEEVLARVAAGAANRGIAGELGISERTVERHLANIFAKLDVASRTEAARHAFAHGLVSGL